VNDTHDNSDELAGANGHFVSGGARGGHRGSAADGGSEREPRSGEFAPAAGEDLDEPPIRFIGDEWELYLRFNRQLQTKVASMVIAQREDVEDACAFAWVQFFATSRIATGIGRVGCFGRRSVRRGV
jgi:hypothetical protein